ncbi:SDR family oxidoreductase [Trueperella abortisuis]|uniref:NAD(P)-dependent dehydrogenase (Short-subunit alcohol dehydrogenase family) n=1 Tax=Trueperella abortisuis TaxID=445930 RepID=A0ABT9PG75_9ACTO|nr:SDR family oxidoreductase [Trueperella abortisuis]MDP9831711.1 NAD(P)-dependent dehydrogenase (short-subunit alcohol dehydrogenase family) [Trueperella abortisuis]
MNNRVLITGGAQGIGAAIADRCAQDGYDVVVLDRIDNPRHHTILVDLSDADATEVALSQALETGAITRLVNNVGAVFPAPADEQTLEQFDMALTLNARTAMQCAQALKPGMAAAGFGRIVSMSSRAALGKADRTAYAASKGALLSMTRVWALEWGACGITANAIGPGPIATELFMKANPPEAPKTQEIINSLPVRRMGTPADVAHATSFFLSEGAGFITGQVLYVCGGITAGKAPL